ncbi:hypothetical protein IAU59_001338 [Kwoniella sp. CBS 9459]
MDCPDCLQRLRKAFRPLQGAKILSLDYVRALGEAECDPDVIDPQAIVRFLSRASGFKIRLGQQSPTGDTVESVILSYVRTYHRDRWNSTKEEEHRGPGEADLSIRADRNDRPEPRLILNRLSPNGPKLVSNHKSHDQVRLDRDILIVSLRTLASTIFTLPILVLVWATQLPGHGSTTYRAVELALATCVMVIAEPIYSGSFRSAWYLHAADLGVLTTVSTWTTYIFSVIAFGFQAAGKPFGDTLFETVGLLVSLVFLGRTVQAFTRKMAFVATESVSKLQPNTVRLLSVGEPTDTADNLPMIDVRLLHYDDTIRILEGEVVPTDGLIIEGMADLEESSITGESAPVTRTVGSLIRAGAKVVQGSIDVSVTRLVANNSLSAVIQTLSKAQNSGNRYQDLADRMAAVLLPIATASATTSLLVWLFVNRYVRHNSWVDSAIDGIKYAIAIMAVACPCALTLAVSLVSCLSVVIGLHRGIIFRTSEAMLAASAAQALAFDKTGTLSQGLLSVSESSEFTPLAMRLVYEITGVSQHPVSVTVRRYMQTQSEVISSTASSAKMIAQEEVCLGGGIKADAYGFRLVAGNAKFTEMETHPLVKKYQQQGFSLFVVTLEGRLIAVYGLLDQPRARVKELLESLGTRGKHLAILSGDNPQAVHRFASGLGLDKVKAHGGLSPSDKAEMVSEVKTIHGSVIFIGDGTNDTLALAKSTIAVAVGSGSGSDIAVAASSIVLLSSDVPRALDDMLEISQSARYHAFAGLGWCAVYFFFAILLASGAAVNFSIPPQWAGLGEVTSILPVLAVGTSVWLTKGHLPT